MREGPLERHWRRCYPNLDIYTLLLFGVEGGGCRVGRHSFLVIERNMAVRPSIILLGVGGSSHFLCRSRSAIADMNGSIPGFNSADGRSRAHNRCTLTTRRGMSARCSKS